MTIPAQTSSEQIIERVKKMRAERGLHVAIEGEDGQTFNYYASTEAQKADFIRRARAQGRNILAVAQ